MPDHLTKEQIHRNMSAIRAKNTKPELLVRKFLFNVTILFSALTRMFPKPTFAP